MQTSPPLWLRNFTDEVGNCLQVLNDPALGCHFHLENDIWEITLFFAATEILGGEQDGVRHQSPFWVDVQRLCEFFQIDQFQWQAHAVDEDDALGTHLSITGNYSGHAVWLRILANSPPELPAGQLTEATCGNVLENW